MRIAWCDKIGIVVAGSLFLILACAWTGPYFWWGTPHWRTWGDQIIWDTAPPLWFGAWEFGWRFVGIPWVVLRLIDLAFGGPARRQGIIVARPVAPPEWRGQ